MEKFVWLALYGACAQVIKNIKGKRISLNGELW